MVCYINRPLHITPQGDGLYKVHISDTFIVLRDVSYPPSPDAPFFMKVVNGSLFVLSKDGRKFLEGRVKTIPEPGKPIVSSWCYYPNTVIKRKATTH